MTKNGAITMREIQVQNASNLRCLVSLKVAVVIDLLAEGASIDFEIVAQRILKMKYRAEYRVLSAGC